MSASAQDVTIRELAETIARDRRPSTASSGSTARSPTARRAS